MLRSLASIVLFAAILLPAAAAHAQKSTERYIPIGKSPGLSGKHTVIGRVREYNMQTRTVTITGASRTWTARLGDGTQIWMDCSGAKHPSYTGTAADCKPGLLCEIKFEGRLEPTSTTCEWIKIRPASAEPAAPPATR